MTGHAYDRLPQAVTEIFGPGATAESAYGLLTVDVPAAAWTGALETARSVLGCTYFDWLSAVDEQGTGFRVCAHVVALGSTVRRLLVRTTVPHEAAVLPTAVGIYAGAGWHERETHEMFGIAFTDHPNLTHLLLPDSFEGHPLRKDFVLAARVAKAWPGAKEPGESAAGAEHGGPRRRQMLPPGVPDPNEWGPLKGQLSPAPARQAQAAGETGERPARRAHAAGEGTAGPEGAARRGDTGQPVARRPRRNRSASEGSASQQAAATPATTGSGDRAGTAPSGPAAGAGTSRARRTRSASDGSVSQRPPATAPDAASGPAAGRRPDAPWHHPRPAFDDSAETPDRERPAGSVTPAPEDGSRDRRASSDAGTRDTEPDRRDTEPDARSGDADRRDTEPDTRSGDADRERPGGDA